MKKSRTQGIQSNRNKHPDYDNLPAGIKLALSEKEYAWLGQEERGRTMERETQPDMDVVE